MNSEKSHLTKCRTQIFVQLLIHYLFSLQTEKPSCTASSLNFFPSSRASRARQTTNQTWQLFTLTGWDERFSVYHSGPHSPKRMGKETDKAGKRPVNFYILGCLGCFPLEGKQTCTQTHTSLYPCVCVCMWARAELQQKHRHTVTNTAAPVFDVQGAVSVVHVCPLKSFSAPGVKHGNKGKQHIQKCQTTHLVFHVCWMMVTWQQLHTVKIQDRLIDTGCWRRQKVSEAGEWPTLSRTVLQLDPCLSITMQISI